MIVCGQRREETAHVTASSHKSGEGDHVTANSHDDLPDQQGIANAVDVIGSGQKTATGHAESGIDLRIKTGLPKSESERDRSGSDPKIATDPAATVRGRTATEKTTASDALDRSTANGKRSESENDGHGHESCPTESGLYDPSLFLDPKIGKHRRIEKGGGPSKILSTHHVTERAAMSGEKQPRKRRGQGESAATEQPPDGAEETEARSHATDECPETLPPLSLDRGRAGEEALRDATPGAPRDTPPPLLKCGKKKKRRKSRAAGLPKKFSRGAKSLMGEIFFILCKFVSSQIIPTAPETNQHKSHKSCHTCKFCPYT